LEAESGRKRKTHKRKNSTRRRIEEKEENSLHPRDRKRGKREKKESKK